MCKAVDYSNSIVEIYRKAQKECNEYNKKLSELDLAITDIEHYIEMENFNAARGYCLAKKLRELRIERRKIKEELEPLFSFVSNKSSIDKIHTNVLNKHKGLENLKVKQIYNPRKIKDDLVTIV